MELTLSIADFQFFIKFHTSKNKFFKEKLYNDIRQVCKGFLLKKVKKSKPHVIINIVHRKLLPRFGMRQKMKTTNVISFYEEKNENVYYSFYQTSLLQFQIMLRTILLKLLGENHGFLLHASSVKVGNKAFIFLGRPGAGKSTIMTILSKKYKPLADDSLIIKKVINKYYAFTTPFMESSNWLNKINESCEVGNIYLLDKSIENKRVKLCDYDYIISRFIKHVWTEKELLTFQMKYILEFIMKYNFYHLSFALNNENLLNFFEK